MPHSLLIPGLIIFLVILGYAAIQQRRHARSHSVQAHAPHKPVQPAQSLSRPAPAVVPEPQAPAPRYVPPPPKTDADWRAELAEATTVGECLDVFNSVPSTSPVEAEAKAKVIELLTAQLAQARDISECWDVRKEIVDADLDWSETNAIVDQALTKAFGFVTTYEEAKNLFIDLEDSDEEAELIAAAVKKAIELADFDECISFISELSGYNGHDADEDAAFRKALSLAATADECEQLRNDLNLNDEEDEEVRIKAIGLTDTVDECQSVWDDAGTDSHVGEVAICRAADIIRKRAARLAGSAVE